MISKSPRLLVLCAIETGADAVARVIQAGCCVVGVVGLNAKLYDREKVSGLFNVAEFAANYFVPSIELNDYSLKSEEDKELILSLDYDVVWVAGWQRLIPRWLIDSAELGVIGVHGSPDGISGGRGRSPQNWAIMLGCTRFDIAIFQIDKGVDDGPIISERSFFYNEFDDIRTSYYKSALLIAEMVVDVLKNPGKIAAAVRQSAHGFYLPQRLPSDGLADWSQSVSLLARHCRALAEPYPGLRTRISDVEVKILACQPFDDCMDGTIGEISAVFITGEFLVSCADGRLLVRRWVCSLDKWKPIVGLVFDSVSLEYQFSTIVKRHSEKNPEQNLSPRLLRSINNRNI